MTSPSEIDLLASLLTDEPDLSVLQNKAAWETIKQQAGRYGVGPLIAYAARPHVTSAERAWCDRVLVDSWARHQRMLKQLEILLELFDREGIPTIALKGPLLAQQYYAPAFLRKPPMDLDLAVMERDLERAGRVLAAAGYLQNSSIAEALARDHHVTFSNPSRVKVELHFRLTHMTRGIPVDQFFERTTTLRLAGGGTARVLGPADQLMHLWLHLAHGRFGTLFHLYEVRRTCGMQTDSVRAEAVERAIAYGFCGALRMIDVAFRVRWNEAFLGPATVVPKTWLNRRLNESLYRDFEEWSTPGRRLNLAARLQGRWLDFQMTDGPRDIVRWTGLVLQTARYRIMRPGAAKAEQLCFAPEPAGGNRESLGPESSEAPMAQDDFAPTRHDK